MFDQGVRLNGILGELEVNFEALNGIDLTAVDQSELGALVERVNRLG